jgi:hypothetical protein
MRKTWLHDGITSRWTPLHGAKTYSFLLFVFFEFFDSITCVESTTFNGQRNPKLTHYGAFGYRIFRI